MADKPNILVIWGDDIGWWNVSAYNHGTMGYRTPNIDRIGREGAMFTDWYGQQSCTAGRAAFITGQSPIRTGLTKVGLPGAKEGLSDLDPTIADLLKPHGYVSGQFGKNHVGDRNEHLPTVHGFDEFFGNLYHLNAEEEPEHPDYPKPEEYPNFRERFGPRGVLHTWARDKDDPKETAHFGPIGKQKIEDTGPLTKKRMETVDEEFTAAALDFMEKAAKKDKPFFVWWNSTRMHIWTHLKRRSQGKTGLGIYPDGMVEHDGHVGRLLDHLDKLGITENTIVIYSTDNGAEVMSWPDGGSTPFRGEKATNWEGGFRVPMLIRWPGVIEPGTVVERHLCARGPPDDVPGGGRRARHRGEVPEGPHRGRQEVQSAAGRLQPAAEPSGRSGGVAAQGVPLLVGRRRHARPAVQGVEGRVPRAARHRVRRLDGAVRRAPRAGDVSATGRPVRAGCPRAMEYHKWLVDHLFLIVPAAAYVGQWLQSFREYPPRMTPASFNLEKVMAEVQKPANKV